MTRQKTIFAFDLDGTVTDSEILPRIARELGIHEEISRLTRLTLEGAIDFEESFAKRFEMLKNIPPSRVREIVSETPLNPHISDFIHKNRDHCAVITGNLDIWVEPLAARLGCRFFSSSSGKTGESLILKKVLRKDEAIKKLVREKENGHDVKIVAIGESVNDIPMFRAADIGVAYAGVHQPVQAVLEMAQHFVHDGESLCALLETL